MFVFVRSEYTSFQLFIPCIVSWVANFISTNKCAILYIMYYTIDLLHSVS
jgi:hypothetical protein